MNKNLIKKLIIFSIVVLLLLICYKIYFILNKTNFKESNFLNIKKIESNEQSDTYSFAVVGSAENSIDIFENKIINEINADSSIEFVISTGNAVLDGAEAKYQLLNNSLNKLKRPFIVGIGDKEISDGGDRRFYKHFGTFYFSFSYGESYYIFIDTTGTTSYELQQDWIKEELTKADKYTHKFVIMNNNPLKANDSKSSDFRKNLLEELSNYKVDCVFTNGSYYEKNIEGDVAYYSSGGAGGVPFENYNYHFLKVEVSSDQIEVNVIEVPLAFNNTFIQEMENSWITIHSLFHIQIINVLIVMFGLLALFLILYKKVSKNVNYYTNFDKENKDVTINRKLNVAMFTNNYLPFVGGVPISINRLAGALRKRGNDVTIFAPKYLETVDSEENIVRCKLLYYKKTKNFNFAITNIYSFKIDREFAKRKYDIIHVHHPFWMGQKGLNLAKKNNIPVVLTYHTRLEMYYENLPFFKLLFKNIVSHKMIKNFAQKCDAIIAPTVSAKQYLENIGVSRQKLVLPTGVDFEKYNAIEESTVISLKNIYIQNGEILLCSVSRLSLEKNIDFLIKGLKQVKENTKVNFKCIIIGNGPERENLQRLIEEYSLTDSVYLLGMVSPEDIPKYYMASDLFVFSSLSETQGMVLLEAMAGKCPVVCVKSSGTNDVVKDGYNGYKTQGNSKIWSEKIIYLLENKEVLSKMSTNAFKYSQGFSLDKMAERVENFYKKLLISKENEPKEK